MNKTVGDLLREARNKKGLALQTIERSTGIATHHLLAIELDQFSLIEPDLLETYLRTYSEVVGVDYNALGLDVANLASLQVEEPVRPQTSFDELVSETHPDYVPETYSSRTYRRSSKSSPKRKKSILPALLVSLLFLLLLAVGLLWVYKTFFGVAFGTKTAPSPSSSVATSSSTIPEPAPAPVPDTQLTVSGGGDSLEVQVTTVQKPVKIEVSLVSGDGSWISLTNSDLDETGMTLNPDYPSYTGTLVEGANQAELYLGVTEGVQVKVNDQVVDLSALAGAAESSILFTVQ